MQPPQTEIIAFLSGREAYSPAASFVRTISTDKSVVFITDREVLKLRRIDPACEAEMPPRLRRRHAQGELAANQRMSPELYLGLRSVNRDRSGALSVGGRGEPVDWLVAMAPLVPEQTLHRIAAEGGATAELGVRLGERIADIHLTAESRYSRAWTRDLMASLRADLDVLEASKRIELSRSRMGSLRDAMLQAALRQLGRLEERRLAGRVRFGHGDLRLRNIFIVDEWPVLFDGAAPNDRLAFADVLYDVAGVLVDLELAGQRPVANALLNRYLDCVGEVGDSALLLFFIAARAVARAREAVEAGELGPPCCPGGTLDNCIALAQSALMPSCPAVLAIGGPAAAGKVTLTRGIAIRSGFLLGARLLSLPGSGTAPAGFGSGWLPYLRSRLRENPFEMMVAEAKAALAAGISVVCHAPFARIKERTAIETAATAAGVPFAGVWLNRSGRPADEPPRRPGRPARQPATPPTDWHEVDTLASEPDRSAAVAGFVATALAGTSAAASDRRPGDRELLARMVDRMAVDRAAITAAPATLRVVEARCSSCQSKVRCRDFLARPERARPHGFCPNATILQQLAETADETAHAVAT